jgi:hypothetical protein
LQDSPEHSLTVYLTYYDGLWTASRFQWSTRVLSVWNHAAHFLLDAIDEAAEQ